MYWANCSRSQLIPRNLVQTQGLSSSPTQKGAPRAPLPAPLLSPHTELADMAHAVSGVCDAQIMWPCTCFTFNFLSDWIRKPYIHEFYVRLLLRENHTQTPEELMLPAPPGRRPLLPLPSHPVPSCRLEAARWRGLWT